jgi:nitroreductase
MELADAIRRRAMCRNFADRTVSDELLEGLIDRARRAPSAGNTQGWGFLLLHGREETARFWDAVCDAAWLADPTLPGLMRADALVVPCYSAAAYVRRYSEPDKVAVGLSKAEHWGVPYWIVDCAFATMLLLLGVVEEGLGGLFFRLREGAEARMRELFEIPLEWSPIGAVAIGWPSQDRGPRGSAKRPPTSREEVVHRGRW